jgi:chromate transport protein ChrA
MDEALSVLIAMAALAGPSVLLLLGFTLYARRARNRATQADVDAG